MKNPSTKIVCMLCMLLTMVVKPMVAQVKSTSVLTLEAAEKIIAESAKYAKDNNSPGGSIAVVDAGGNLIAFHRLDGSFPASAEVAIAKAKTAATFKTPSKKLEDSINGGRQALITVGKTFLQGGILIMYKGEVIGGVGVSGASSAQQDEEVAIAGSKAKTDRMAEMRPFLGGGDMIREVTRDSVTYNDPPMKFEAGTPGIVQQIGLGVALDYVSGLGMANIAAHERGLRDYARTKLAGLNWLTVQGTSETKGAIFSFTLQGQAHAHDISTILDKRGIAVRAGTHCAMPLMQHFGVGATCRASFGLYNTTEEVDALISALELCHELFG